MKATEHQGRTLKYLAIEPDNYDSARSYPLIILLHGFGAHMADLAGLCPAIGREGYVYICPNAPLPVQVGFGMMGYAWTPMGPQRAIDDIERAADMLAELVDEVFQKYRVEPGNAILGGFSQGGMMTYWYGLTRPDLFRGLAALSSRIPEEERMKERLSQERSQAIFISHGTEDALIPVEDGRKSRMFLLFHGYRPVYREYQMGHQITQQVLNDLVPWTREVLPPIRAQKEQAGS